MTTLILTLFASQGSLLYEMTKKIVFFLKFCAHSIEEKICQYYLFCFVCSGDVSICLGFHPFDLF